MATVSPRNLSCLRVSSASWPDSARTIRWASPYLRRRSLATARDTPGSSSTVSITGFRDAVSALAGLVIDVKYALVRAVVWGRRWRSEILSQRFWPARISGYRGVTARHRAG